MFFFYVIESCKDNRWYKGVSANVEVRVKQHNAGMTQSTKGYRPWKLIYQESFDNFADARKAELYYKSGSGREKLKNKILQDRPRGSTE